MDFWFGSLKKFRNIDDFETRLAFFKTRVPAVAPKAYLTIIFKPTSREVVEDVAKELALPAPMINFFERCNGAHLFAGTLSIYGCLPKTYLLDRSDPFSLPPFNIRDINDEVTYMFAGKNLVCIASYSYDGSLVCIHRETGEIMCFSKEDPAQERKRWGTLQDWLRTEVERLSLMFDEDGNRLVAEHHLLPGTGADSSVG